VSLRLLYLIFQHALGLLLLMSRASSTKTSSSSSCGTRSPRPAAVGARNGPPRKFRTSAMGL